MSLRIAPLVVEGILGTDALSRVQREEPAEKVEASGCEAACALHPQGTGRWELLPQLVIWLAPLECLLHLRVSIAHQIPRRVHTCLRLMSHTCNTAPNSWYISDNRATDLHSQFQTLCVVMRHHLEGTHCRTLPFPLKYSISPTKILKLMIRRRPKIEMF